jgi:hypothetical protein
MASTDNLDLSTMTAKQLRNVCTARGMTPASRDIKKLLSHIESGAPALNGKLFEQQSITHARHISGSVNAASTLSVTDQNNSKVKPKFLSCLVLSHFCRAKNIFIVICFSLHAALEVIFILVRLQSNVDDLLTPDERKCLEILRIHSVDSHKLEKLIDQSVNQADAILGEYAKYAEGGHANRMPAQLAKAFLNGVFTGTVTHLNDKEQRDLQIPPLIDLVNNKQTPALLKSDDYLGEGNGIKSRLASIKKLQSKAQSNLNETRKALQTYAPCLMESVADSIKQTGSAYTELFLSLDKSVMEDVSVLVKSLGGVAEKSCQPPSKHYPLLTDEDGHNPLFMVPLLHDAKNAKKRLDAFVEDIVAGVDGVERKRAPLKTVERAMVKVYEKYECNFAMLTDLARITIVCDDEFALKSVLLKLKTAVDKKTTTVVRIKFRLEKDEKIFDAMEAGGYRDILVNMFFPPQEEKESEHIVELQLNLKKFVQIKDGGGHASYAVARMLQAFDAAAVTYTGIINQKSARDIGTGLIKKATLVGVDAAETEMKLTQALGSSSVQLVELKLLNIKFSSVDMASLDWLTASAMHLAATLKVLQINSCEVKSPIPPAVGMLHQLVELNLSDNKIDGANKRIFHYGY